MSSEDQTKVGSRVVYTSTSGLAVSTPPVTADKVSDRRNSAMGITNRASESSFRAVGIGIAVIPGLIAYTISGY